MSGSMESEASGAVISNGFFFGSSVSIWWWTYVSYCRSAVAQKLFSTGPGILRRAEWKETVDGLNRTSCDSLFQSEMVWAHFNNYLRFSIDLDIGLTSD